MKLIVFTKFLTSLFIYIALKRRLEFTDSGRFLINSDDCSFHHVLDKFDCKSFDIQPGLFTTSPVLLWARPAGQTPYKPHRNQRSVHCIITTLLLTIETNPGPTQTCCQCKPNTPNAKSLTVACWNVRSAVHKAALIHDAINESHIDILALNETWVQADHPPAISNDLAPPGYHVDHVHRTTKERGGGLAITYRDLNLNLNLNSVYLRRLFPLAQRRLTKSTQTVASSIRS